VRNPGRRDGDDARAGSIDPTVPQAGSDGGPADDELVGVRASDSPRTTEPHSADHASPAGNDDVGGLDGNLVDDLDLDAGPADMDDDLLFDPLLSDEPIDLAAVRADDALIDALSGGDLAGADDLADDDPLIAMLAAWAASARPDAAAAPHSTDPDAAGSVPHLRPVTAAPTDETVGVEPAADGHPDVLTASTGSPDGEAPQDGATDTGPPEQDEADGVGERRSDLDPPTVRLAGPRRPTADDRPANPGTTRPSLAGRLPDDHGPLDEPGDGPGGASSIAATATASVVTLLSRVRTAGRRTRPPGQALPPGHPLRRAAVAVVVAALGVSGAAASGGTAQPGDPAWAITKVFFADRARSVEAAQVVSAGLERAQILLSQRQPELAKQVLAAVAASLPSVRDEEGHTRLVDQKRMLEAVAALTPPLPGDPNLTATTTPSRKTDPDTSVLAQGGPRAAVKDKAAPPGGAKPADPAPGSTGTTPGGTGTADAGTTGTGTTGTTSTEKGTTGTSGTRTTGSQTGTGSTAVDSTGPADDDTALAESATGPAANDTAPADTGPPANNTGPAANNTGPAANNTGPAANNTGPPAADTAPARADTGRADDTTLAEADTGAQAAIPAPVPSLDAARGAGSEPPAVVTTTDGTSTDGTTSSESVASAATEPEAGAPAPATPPTADEPAPVTILGATEQAPADVPAPVGDQADGKGNPSAGAADAPKALAAGSAPAVPADAAGPTETGGAVLSDTVPTMAETGVVPEPVNVATPRTTAETTAETTTKATTETSDKPTRDTAADRASSSADTPTRTPPDTTSAGDNPEPVHVAADDNRGPGSSLSGSDSGSNSGSGGGSDSGDGSNNDDSSSDDSSSDTGGPGGARTSAAVSIHP
jgi:hypothetical protein